MSAITIVDAASRVLMGTHGWTILECDASSIDRVAQELVEELEFLADEENQTAINHLAMGSDGHMFVDELTKLPPSSVCVVPAKAVDLVAAIGFVEASRGRLLAGPNIVLVTDRSGAQEMAMSAPNLWSWVGARRWDAVRGMLAADVPARLDSLRAATGQTDEEIVGLAEEGRLSPDPLYAEWLALLGRGDLLGN